MLILGREVTGSPAAALRREWLVTNGIGGFAMGSLLAGAATRRYHGLLIAALDPPLGRALFVAGLEAWAELDGVALPLSSHQFIDHSIAPEGWRHLQSVSLEGTIPVLTFASGDVLIEQRIWMAQGRNTTYVQLRHARGRTPADLRLRPLVTARDYHGQSLPRGWQPQVRPIANGALVDPGAAYPSFRLLSDQATFVPLESEWLEGIYHCIEAEREHDDQETLFVAGEFRARLQPGEELTLVFTAEDDAQIDGQSALRYERERLDGLLRSAGAQQAPAFIRQLVLAADQFIIQRRLPGGGHGASVIAGYPWFTDWGRDTMLSLPGLTLATGRPELAAGILRTFGEYLSRGMLPNRFPDYDEQPEYNTVDASLWYFEAVRATVEYTDDLQLASELYAKLEQIIEWHRRGTRYAIAVADDGLLRAGVPGVQLTWMDVKVDDWVVTPRIGKPVEINALWYNALMSMADLARRLGREDAAHDYQVAALRVRQAFERYWYADGGYLFDVLDGPDGADARLRPNQLIAVALRHSPLSAERAKQVVDVCARHLLVSYGLRSLAPGEPDYLGTYVGDLPARDGAYHQGTTWSWLAGPFVSAYLRVYDDAEQAASLLEPFAQHLSDAGLGTISEIFDGNAPFAPRGCPAQAWSVAEVLRCWREIEARWRRK